MSVIDLRPPRLDIRVYRGDTVSLPFQVLDDATGDPVDLTGYTITAEVRKERLDATAYQSFSVVVSDAANGLFSLVMNPATTAAFECGEHPRDIASRYEWDLELKAPDDVVRTRRHGTFVVTADATH